MENGFKGLWPAMFTPVDAHGDPAFDELEKLVELLISQNLDGLYILGSSGQGVLFREDQRKEIAARISGQVAGRIPVIAQVGALTTAESIRLAQHAEKVGVSGISSVGPIYYSASADMALLHYKAIAGATGLPFFPYQLGDDSIPGNALEFVERLLEIPNVAGMKLTTSQLLKISAIHNFAGDRLKLFSGSDELLCHASLCGTVGAIGSTYNLWGAQCRYVLNEFVNGNYHLTRDFMLAFQEVIDQILPNIWTFLRKAMLLKYNIDIGQPKAPLANSHRDWHDDEVTALMEKVESVARPVLKTVYENTPGNQ